MQIRGLISSCATLFALLRASLLVILLALLVAWKASAIVDWTRAAWILRELPRPSGNIVYSGVRRLLTGKRLRVMQAVNESVVGGSGVFYYNILWGHMVVVSEPRLVAELLHNTNLAKPTYPVMIHFRQLMSPTSGADFLSAEGDSEDWLWRAVRRGVAPAFAPKALRRAYPKVARVGVRLTEILLSRPQQTAIDMSDVCMCETIDALGLAGFDKAFNSIEAISEGRRADLLHIIYTANEEVARGLYNPAYKLLQMLPLPRNKGQMCMRRFHTIMQDLLQEMRARGPPADADDSIAAHLMRITDPSTGQLLSDKSLLPQVSVLFWAGFDTTGNTMAWTLYCISQHPEVEQKIVAELREHGLLATPQQPHPRGPDYADLDKLTYLTCVIKEAMRVHTVVGLPTLRMSKHRDLIIDDGRVRIPRNTTIWIPLGLPHASSAVYPNADQFLPDRWLEPDAEYMPTPGQAAGHAKGALPDRVSRFLPFSDGKRQCVGMAFAKMNYTSVLARLLGTFTFELAPQMGGSRGVLEAENYAITLMPSKGMWMNCKPRATAATA